MASERDRSKPEYLESKVDQLVQLLQQKATSVPNLQRSVSEDVAATTHQFTALTPSNGLEELSPIPTLNPILTSDSSVPRNRLQTPLVSFPSAITAYIGEPSISEAEEYFHTFRTRMLQFFPIVTFGVTDTSQTLKEERPFLWLCIMAVACNSTPQQFAIGESVKEVVAREMICRSRKNTDLLVGLLIFTAWGHYQHRWMAFLTDFLQLAISLVFDLGLNRPPMEPRGSICFKAAMRTKHMDARPATASPREKSMEERRAVLGCYLASSMASVTLKRLDGLRWTTELDASLKMLCEKPECPGDTILAIQVKLQLLIEKVDRTYSTWPFGNSLYTSSAQTISENHVDALLAQSTLLLAEAPSEVAQSVLTRYHCTRLLLHETLLSDSNQVTYMLNLKRIERHNACMSSIKCWFEIFLNTPPEGFIGFTFLDMCGMAYNVLVLVRFTMRADSAWDRQVVRKTVDIIQIAGTIADIYQQASQKHRVIKGYEEIDFFADSASIFLYMKNVWKQEVNGIFEIPQWVNDPILAPDSTMEWDSDSFWLNMLS
ncbi:Fc.00g011070.m01.CDS01 [Cosmosporella sp. VM-42]